MNKKEYTKPTIEINLIDSKDVVTTSISEWDPDKNDGIEFGSKFNFTMKF